MRGAQRADRAAPQPESGHTRCNRALHASLAIAEHPWGEAERALAAAPALDQEDHAMLWRVLVHGELSIVEIASRGPRRIFLARRRDVPERLSAREERVMHLLGRGLSNKEIAFELSLSLSGVGRGIEGARASSASRTASTSRSSPPRST